MRNQSDRHRRSIRLTGYDYREAGAYFITVCTHGRRCLFCDVIDGEMRLNDAGRVVYDVWDGLPTHYLEVELGAFVVMPNHAHGIAILASGDLVEAGFKPAPTVRRTERRDLVGAGFKLPLSTAPTVRRAERRDLVGAGFKPAPTVRDAEGRARGKPTALRHHGLPEIVRGFKTFTARQINQMHASSGMPVWQRNYYEHIIRNEESLSGIRQYIADNPARWADDPENLETSNVLGGRV